MNNFTVERTPLAGLLVIHSKVYGDNRGYFIETFNERSFVELGLDTTFAQDNRSRSCKNTLRGLHFQKTHPQGKLVGVTSGEVFDVAVDLRRGSPSFGEWHGIRLTDADGILFYVPPGFAHGFCVLSDSADFFYKCTDLYAPGDEGGLLWNDPELGIDWPIDGAPILAEKDTRNPSFRDCFKYD